MKSREVDPRRLDMRAFARDGAELQGSWPLSGFERLLDLLAEPAAPDQQVSWSAQGRQAEQAGGSHQTWLHLQGCAAVSLRCQRCLEPMQVPLAVDRRYLFVRDEAEAARVDDEIDDDVLVITRELDLHELLEDEMLLEMPLVPRHDVCQAPAVAAADTPAAHPAFDALAALRRAD